MDVDAVFANFIVKFFHEHISHVLENVNKVFQYREMESGSQQASAMLPFGA